MTIMNESQDKSEQERDERATKLIQNSINPIKLPDEEYEEPTGLKKKWLDLKDKIDDVIVDITPAWMYRLKRACDDFYYGRIKNKHWKIVTDLPRTAWHDSDSRMLYGMMKVLEDFIEKDNIDIVNWDGTPEHQHAKSEMDTIYVWWKNYSNRQKEIEDALHEWFERFWSLSGDREFSLGLQYINKKEKDEKERELSDHLHELEAKLIEEEEDMLLRLVKIRCFMWT